MGEIGPLCGVIFMCLLCDVYDCDEVGTVPLSIFSLEHVTYNFVTPDPSAGSGETTFLPKPVWRVLKLLQLSSSPRRLCLR